MMKNSYSTGFSYQPTFTITLFLLLSLVVQWTTTTTSTAAAAAAVASYSLSNAEYDALFDLFNSTHGTNWTWIDPSPQLGYPWVFQTPRQNPCSSTQPWQGITCNNNCGKSQCYVTSLTLSDHALNGTLSPSLHQLSHLTSLILPQNHLTGTIPSSLGNLTSLQYLVLYDNKLTGTIPCTLGNLTYLEYLFLDINQFTGTIPNSFGKLTQLRFLYLNTNQLTGTIPSFWDKMLLLEYLELYANRFTGTIPASFSSLPVIEDLQLYQNLLTGTLPSSFGNLTTLYGLDISTNRLSGTIPSSWGNLTKLETFGLDLNQLIGTIPSTLGNLCNVEDLFLNLNLLSGTIPSSLGNLTKTTVLMLYENQLTGTIPSSLGNMTALEDLYLYDNQLTGAIPGTLQYILSLRECVLNNNLLSGTIPTSILNIQALIYLDVGSNRLSGAIPSVTIGDSLLQQLVLSSNSLTSTIPNALQRAKSLTLLYLDNNQLTGTFPSTVLTNLNRLRQFYVQSNYLSGTLPTGLSLSGVEILYLYNNSFWGAWFEEPSHLTTLQSIDLSNNMLSGSIQQHWFENITLLESISLNNNHLTGVLVDSMFTSSSRLSSVLLATNCFTGTIPSSICNSLELTQVIMDGLHSASSCIHYAIPWLPNSGIVSRANVHGTIPHCLLSLPMLTTLHLGGNAFAGTIPNGPLSANMETLTLSSNQLTGTVSEYIWRSNITSLDLSFNRLQGTLPSTMLPAVIAVRNNGTVNLNNNQFSGVVSSSVLPLNNINVLDGNLFSCNVERSNIPSHDPKYNSYTCGSDTTNISLIVFCICGSIVVFIYFFYWIANRESYGFPFEAWLRYVQDNTMFARLMRYCLMISVLCLSIGMLLYGILTMYYSTYADSYAWTVSAIYKSGIVSAVLMLLWLIGILMIAQYMLYRWRTSYYVIETPVVSSLETKLKLLLHRCWGIDFVTILVSFVNVVVITTINGFYVYAVRSNLTSKQLIACALTLSVIKLVMLFISIRVGPIIGHKALIGICLFNNLVAPFLAELVVSSDCFLYVVSKQSALRFVFDVYSCPVINIDGLPIPCNYNIAVQEDYSTFTTLSISPAFHYSYECSSSLISSYVYIFVFRYILTGVISPCMNWCVRRLLLHLPKSSPVRKHIEVLTPIVWRVWECRENDDRLCDEHIQNLEQYAHNYLGPHFVVTMVSDFSNLVCFGVLFPPLAIVIMVSVYKDIMVVRWTQTRLQQLKEAFAQDESMSRQITNLISLIDAKYKIAEGDIYYGLQWGLCITGVIWAFVLFDTLSSTEGVMSSIWIAVLMTVAPWLLWFMSRLNLFSNNSCDIKTSHEAGVIIVEVTNPVIFCTDIKHRKDQRHTLTYDENDNDVL